jgi:rhamnose utilization protein RhaD (predicted bifunctional aldolase and dehydrogenase)
MNISFKYLNESAKIARLIGATPDWVQGGGGNFSIKIDDEKMLIKASGLPLKEVDTSHGIVVVDYLKVKKYYDSLSGEKITIKIENLSNQAILGFTSNFLPRQNLKASIEAGFHTFLKKYTLHSHSVYANIINCSTNPEKILKEIFNKTNIEYVISSYAAPGLSLTREIKNSIDKYLEKGRGWPEVIFLRNHGIIINADKLDRCLELYILVDELVKKYFNIKPVYPKVSIKKKGENFQSNTVFLKKYFDNNILNKNLFQPILFPDQVVYLNRKIFDKKNILQIGDKLSVDKKTKEVFYHTNKKESLTIEETVVAYCYIKDSIKRLGLKLNKISNDDINFINQMESEKYRQMLLKK